MSCVSPAIAPDADEVYVSETTYALGSRGERHDFVTVYDTVHYAAQAHIPLPTGKRALMGAQHRMTLLADSRFLAVYNYTPATSLSIVDLVEHRHVGEAPAPGCHLAYPTGERGVSMLCGDVKPTARAGLGSRCVSSAGGTSRVISATAPI